MYIIQLFLSMFQIDSNYVGVPPAVEVTISNLNDNIDKGFLFDMVRPLSFLSIKICIFNVSVDKEKGGVNITQLSINCETGKKRSFRICKKFDQKIKVSKNK
jgi:hypothetical protein